MKNYYDLNKHAKEINEVVEDLHDIIDYDEWAGREYGEDKVDYYWTAVKLLQAGYRRKWSLKRLFCKKKDKTKKGKKK